MTEHVDAPPVTAIFEQDAPNAPIEYGEVTFEFLDCGDETPSVNARFIEEFTHQTHFKAVVDFVEDCNSIPLAVFRHYSDLGNTIRVRLPEFNTIHSVICTQVGPEGITYIPSSHPLNIRPETNEIATATFHLVNWPQFWGEERRVLRTGNPPHQGGRVIGFFTLEADGWRISVSELAKSDEIIKALKSESGYAITHAGRVERIDGGNFSTEQLNELLGLLRYFFSYMLGRWSSPHATVGFDANGGRVFEQWGFGRNAVGAADAISVFDRHHSEIFSDLFPAFYTLWQDALWNDSLRRTIYWYVAANTTGGGVNVDSGLLFTQAALELLAWNYCVKDKAIVSERTFSANRIAASEKLSILAGFLGVPTEIPPQFEALHARRGTKFRNGMDAITDLRNGLVHPKESLAVADGSYYEAWRLSLWFIEVLVLKICAYSGKYANRLVERYVGEVESLP